MTIKPFVRILVKYIHFQVEFNSWSESLNSVYLMNGLDFKKSFTFNKCITQSINSSECSFSAFFLPLFFYTSTDIAFASFCAPLLCYRTEPKKDKLFITQESFSIIYNFLLNLLLFLHWLCTLSARGFIDNRLKWWKWMERLLGCRLYS